MDFDALPEVPQDEFDLVGRLYPESAWMFVWARRILRRFAGEQVSRFLVGCLEPGCWSVLRAEDAWVAVRCADGVPPAAPVHAVYFTAAQDAVAHAMAGVILDASVVIHTQLLREMGVLERLWEKVSDPAVWQLGDVGRRLIEATADAEQARYADRVILLDPLIGRGLGYEVCPQVPPPDSGTFIDAHLIFAEYARTHLPGDFGANTGEQLPEGTLLDSYDSSVDRYLFALTTPFCYRAQNRVAKVHTREFFVTQRPLFVYPGLPIKITTIPDQGVDWVPNPKYVRSGYLFHGTVGDLLTSGDIIRVTEAKAREIHAAREKDRQRNS